MICIWIITSNGIGIINNFILVKTNNIKNWYSPFEHPCLTDPSKVLILLGVSSQETPAWGLLGVCLGCLEPMPGDVRFMMFAWGFYTFLLGDEFFEWRAWGCGFQGLLCLGTSISAPLSLGDLLGVDLLGSVRQGCKNEYVENIGFTIHTRLSKIQPCLPRDAL